MGKTILYITFDGLSDPLGQSQILPYLLGIAKNGFSITIISCEKKDRLNNEQEIILSKLKGLPINWQYIIYNAEGNFISRLQYIRKVHKLAKHLHQTSGFSMLHCRSYLSALIGLKFKKKFNVPFIFDMRGFWADERIDGNIWNKSNPLHFLFYRYFKYKEKQFINNSGAIVSLTQTAINELQKQFKDISSKTSVIPCCVDLNLFEKKQIDRSDILSALKLTTNDHILIYTGSIGTWYYTKEMIDCVLAWRSKIPNIKLLIVTRDKEELDHILSSYSAEQRSIIVSTQSSYAKIPELLSVAHASVFFIKPAYSKKASSPTKMAECLAMNLPIITNAGIGDNDHYIKTLNGGILLNGFSENNYAKAGEDYLALLKTNTSYRHLAVSFFDKDKAIETYVSIYTKLINESSKN